MCSSLAGKSFLCPALVVHFVKTFIRLYLQFEILAFAYDLLSYRLREGDQLVYSEVFTNGFTADFLIDNSPIIQLSSRHSVQTEFIGLGRSNGGNDIALLSGILWHFPPKAL